MSSCRQAANSAGARTRRLMREAVPDCTVTRFEHFEDGLDPTDPDDRHVLAAAICANAQTIVAFKLRGFPGHVLARYDIDSKHPDEFVMDLLDLAPGAVVRCARDQVSASCNPPMTMPEVLDTLRRLGLVQSVTRLRELLSAA